MAPEAHSSDGVDISAGEGDVTIGGDVVNRDKIINVTVQQFVDGTVSLEKQLEFFRQQIGLETAQTRYAASQFESCAGVWRSLQALRLAGDDLWNRASVEHLTRFTEELRKTELVVRQGEIFFEEADRTDLLALLHSLGEYRLGRLRLIDIRSKEEAEYDAGGLTAVIQIQASHQYKEDYEQLVEKVRLSFKERLSSRPA